ncbi:hypothetical protein [Streptomyces vilmorinianum]|uniref:hypothetical protein n=1 Tax=Streptomyces vilmorinianum TaxID=3051092 RepID=UPI0020C78ABF|nr:hypothetical protein [Streptomyces vilmorinianum]
MTGQGRAKALLWTGVGVGAVGVVALVVVAVADLGKADQIASVVGAVLAAAGLGLSLWSRGGGGVSASGERSVAAGGNIGSVATGNGAQAGPAPTMPAGGTPAAGTLAAGPVTASGDRSVAAGGDIGSVSTGDA